jgi:glycogen(starch) synthase
MKVLAFTPQYLPHLGGIEILVDSLAQSLRHRLIEKIVVTDQPSQLAPRDVVNDTVVHRLNFTRAIQSRDTASPLSVLHQLIEVYETEKPDLIHMHSATQASAWYVARLFRKLSLKLPFIVTQHGVLESVDRLKVVRELLLKADALTAVSDAALQSALQFSNRTAFSTVIYNGIRKSGDAIRANQTGPRNKLLCVGRLQHEKGFDIAIAALAKVRSTGFDAKLSIIGSGEYRGYLERVAFDYEVTDHVSFEGVLDHPSTQRAIANCSLVLVPSRTREGFSLVAAEAALCGIPCVASRVGGLSETVEDGVSGRLVAPDDPNDFALAIVDLLGDDELWHALSENARRRAEKKFDLNTCVERYTILYRKLCGCS